MIEQRGNENGEFDLLEEELLTRGVDEIIGGEEIKRRMGRGDKLRVKFGTDPTSPNIHIGRAVPLLKLRDFQILGHQIVLIIGDFTGEVGDTSDKPSGRSMLTKEKVVENMETYAKQCGKILDLSKTEIRYNSEWLSLLTFGEVCRLADMFSVSEFIQRSIIRDRLDSGQRVSVRELMYPLMQGYDSVVVNADLELGGNDQRYNLLAGREIQRHFGQNPQSVITMHLIDGLDGRKMSSSWGNVVKLTDSNRDMFGKIMSISDNLVPIYFEHCTRVPMRMVRGLEVRVDEGKINPMLVKLELAHEITRLYHGNDGADDAREFFKMTIQDKSVPTDITEISVKSRNILDVLIVSGFTSSKNEGRRLIMNKGIKVNGIAVKGVDDTVPVGAVIQKGKRNFVKVI
jgi:tyrosyl-tRNA synthetase